MIEIVEIKDKSGIIKFVDVASYIYKQDKFFVPPLKSDLVKTLLGKDNPLFMSGEHTFFIAYKDGKPAGRILAGINESLTDKKASEDGYISLFESINDKEVAFKLFDSAIEWLRLRGRSVVKGPVSPTNGDDSKGLLVKGFDGPPVLMNSYNPEYYVSFFEEYGFEKHEDLFAYFHNVRTATNMERHGRVSDYAMKRYNFRVDSINLKDLDKEVSDIKAVLDIAMPAEWEDLVPPTLEELKAEVAKLKPLVDKDLVIIARSEDRPVGFAIAIPDYNQVLMKLKGKLFPFGFLKFLWYRKKIKGFRIFVLFVIPEFRKKAVSGAILYRMYRNGLAKGYEYAEGSTIGEYNTAMRNDIEKTGGIHYRTYRLYKKEIWLYYNYLWLWKI